jgi:hypothetical protein
MCILHSFWVELHRKETVHQEKRKVAPGSVNTYTIFVLLYHKHLLVLSYSHCKNERFVSKCGVN